MVNGGRILSIGEDENGNRVISQIGTYQSDMNEFGQGVIGWPSVEYGDVPDSFSQLVPSSGSPPKLIEDRLYAARIVGDRDAKTTLFFQIRNSKAVNVTDKLFDR